MPRWSTALAALVGALAMLLYAGQFVVSRWSIQRTLTLWDLGALRFAVAGLLMLPLVARHGMTDAAGVGWGRALVLSITAGAPAGLTVAPAGHGAVIIPGVTPVVSALWSGSGSVRDPRAPRWEGLRS